MKEDVIKYFADPQNRLKALKYMLENIKWEFLCIILKNYCRSNSKEIFKSKEFPKFQIEGMLTPYPIELMYPTTIGYLKLHELIPELIHPVNLPGADYQTDATHFMGEEIPDPKTANVWGVLLSIYYINTGSMEKYESTITARKIHIENAIKLIKTKI